MYTYRITISYDGTRYQGWQRQMNTDQTIQRILEWTIGKLLGHSVQINGSGRTDSGVHAFAQEASMVVEEQLDVEQMRADLNRQLPEDIRIIQFAAAPISFHARKSAVGKCYEYYVDTREKADVFTRKYCFHFPRKLNLMTMLEAAELLKGTHNFAAFTDLKDNKDTVRTIYDIQIEQRENKIRFLFYGEGFLYHMVRILVGTLLEMGTGEKYPSQIPVMIASGDRAWTGFPAPARGLFLKQVYYEYPGYIEAEDDKKVEKEERGRDE